MSKKPLGRSIGEITQARVKRDPEFARALLQEAVQALLSDDVPAARSLIRDVIKGSIGYATLSRRTGTPEKSLVRMFGTNGNPTAANLFAVLTHLQHHYSGVTSCTVTNRLAKGRLRDTQLTVKKGAFIATLAFIMSAV
jgi:DNA-binding phage protein